MFPKLLYRSSRREQWFGHQSSVLMRVCALLVLLVACIAIIGQVLKTTRTNDEISQLKLQTTVLREKSVLLANATGLASKPQGSKNQPELVNENKRRGLNTVIRQLNTPWQDLFDQLEKSTPKGIALLSIEPDAVRSSIRFSAEAKRLETLLAFTSELQDQGVFGRLTYSKHETNDQDNNKPVRLNFELDMRMPKRLDSNSESARR